MNQPLAVNDGIVSLSFDDALDQHLDFALPILEEQGLYATFYTHLAAPAFTKRLDEWRAAAHHGHELGNHSVFHPADRRKAWVRPGNEIDRYTVDRMQQELELANRWLNSLDGCSARTFAYPCSNSIIGHRGVVKGLLFKLGWERSRLPALVDRWHLDLGSTETSYVPVVRNLFLAARAGGLTKESRIPPLSEFDRFQLPSVAVDGWSVGELIEFTERGLANGTWVNLQFHGVGGGHRLDCDANVFREFIAWLSQHCAGRVATIRDVAACLWEDVSNSVASQEAAPASA